MSFKEWREWFKELPWTVKWFVVLILLRPIIDNFYKLKEVSPFLSPLNIVGVLTPILILISIASKSSTGKTKSKAVIYFYFFGFLVIVNWILLMIFYTKISVAGDLIKSMIPLFLLLYLQYAIKSQRDLHGLMTSFMYSGIYLLVLLLYETFFGSISGVTLTEGRGGGERLLGFYNDMMNYAIYIVGALLIGCYFFLKNIFSKVKSKNYVLKFAGLIAFCMVGLMGIKHASTWAVCLLIFGLMSFYNLKSIKGFFAVLFLIMFLSVFFGETIYNEQIEPLINKEINVASGESEIEGGLNGRIGRWERYFDVWFSMPFYSQLFGVSTSGSKLSLVMCGAGMHNDYVRLLFTTGIVGITFYLLFLIVIVYRAMYFRIPEKFLILGAIMALMLHSISTVPLDYSAYLYILFSIFCFALLPVNEAYRPYSWNRRKRKKIQVRPLSINEPTPTLNVNS